MELLKQKKLGRESKKVKKRSNYWILDKTFYAGKEAFYFPDFFNASETKTLPDEPPKLTASIRRTSQYQWQLRQGQAKLKEIGPQNIWQRFILLPVSAIVTGVIVGSIYSVLTFKTRWNFERPEKMSMVDYASAQTLVKDTTGGQNAAAYVSEDLNHIWAVTNAYLTGPVEIEFESIPTQLLAKNPVRFVARGQLDRHLTSFDQLEFLTGDKIALGKYKVHLRQIGPLVLPWPAHFMPYLPQAINQKWEMLVGYNSEALFEKELAQYLEQTKVKDDQDLIEITMKFETLAAITKQIEDGLRFAIEMGPKQKHKTVSDFELKYSQNYGRFFTSFLLDIQNTYDQMAMRQMEHKDIYLSELALLINLSKSVGQNSMKILSQIKNAKKSRDWGELRVSVDRHFLSFEQDLALSMQKLKKLHPSSSMNQ